MLLSLVTAEFISAAVSNSTKLSPYQRNRTVYLRTLIVPFAAISVTRDLRVDNIGAGLASEVFQVLVSFSIIELHSSEESTNLPAGLYGKTSDLHAVWGPTGSRRRALLACHFFIATRTTRELDYQPLSEQSSSICMTH